MSSSSPISLTHLLLVAIVLFFMSALHYRSFARPHSWHLGVSPRQIGSSTPIPTPTPSAQVSRSGRSPLSPSDDPEKAAPGFKHSSGSGSSTTMGSDRTSSDSGSTSGDPTTTKTTTTTTSSSSSSSWSSTTTTTTDTKTPIPQTFSTASSSSSSPSRTSTSSPTFSPSPSPSASRSSSTIVTSETSQVTSDSDPQTTLVLNPDSSTTIVVQTIASPSPVTTGRVASSSSGFLHNKGAAAGTFTVLALVLLGAIIAVVLFLRRRRRAAADRDRGDSEFFTNFAPEPEMTRSTSARTVSGAGHSVHTSESGPSLAELATQTPMDAYAANQHYTPTVLHGLSTVQEQELSSGAARETEPSFYSTSSHPTQLYYIPPPGQGSVPPMQNRKIVARGSYQPSIDSFYGAV